MAHVGGPAKELSADGPLMLDTLQDLGAHFLKEPRHGKHDGGAHLDHVLRDLFNLPGEGDGASHLKDRVIPAHPLEGVGEWEEGEDYVVACDRDYIEGGPTVGEKVVVSEHHPFGRPGGAGRVDHGCHVVGVGAVQAFLKGLRTPGGTSRD